MMRIEDQSVDHVDDFCSLGSMMASLLDDLSDNSAELHGPTSESSNISVDYSQLVPLQSCNYLTV